VTSPLSLAQDVVLGTKGKDTKTYCNFVNSESKRGRGKEKLRSEVCRKCRETGIDGWKLNGLCIADETEG